MTQKTLAERAYGFERRFEKMTMADAVDRVTAALKKEGFGILTQIDVQDTLRKKLGAEFRPYLILGACNPTLSYRALSIDPQVGLLLPCNVVIQEASGGISVSIVDPRAMFAVVDNLELAPIVDDVDDRLRRVLASI